MPRDKSRKAASATKVQGGDLDQRILDQTLALAAEVGWDQVRLRRVAQEVAQSSSEVDPSLPVDEQQRLWIRANGIVLQRVNGYAIDGDLLTVTWSPRISYLHNSTLGQVTRSVEGGPSRVVARGVESFVCRRTTGGQITIELVTRAGSAGRGQEARHRGMVRVTPRNALR